MGLKHFIGVGGGPRLLAGGGTCAVSMAHLDHD